MGYPKIPAIGAKKKSAADELDSNGEIKNGNIEYRYCDECGEYFGDEYCADDLLPQGGGIR